MRRRGLGSVLVGFGAALALVIGSQTAPGHFLWVSLLDGLTREAYSTPHSWIGLVAWRALDSFAHAMHDLSGGFLALGCLATLGGVIARTRAWLRVRDGRADPLDRLRSRPGLVRALTAAPALLFSSLGLLVVAVHFVSFTSADAGIASFLLREDLSDLLAIAGTAALLYAFTRGGLRALLAPVEKTEAASPKDAGDLVFSAVAVTARTRAAVGALAAATVGMIAWTLAAPDDPRFLAALAAYVAAAMAAPFVLRRVSRIAVGIDGVWVRDASRERFFAYRDLDEARARGTDLELVRGGRAIMRLQMHGEDAGRRDEVLARVNDAVATSRTATVRGAEMVVQAMPARRVAASLHADDYRLPSVSREQLWELVEGPTTDAGTRTAAAEALATRFDGAERVRLRVAAARCAEPLVRVALDALAGDDADAEAGPGLRKVVAGRV